MGAPGSNRHARYWILRHAAPAHASDDLHRAFQQLQHAPDADLQTSLEEYLAAHQAHSAASAADNSARAALFARFHIPLTESPNRNLTDWISNRRNTHITAIKAPSGALVTNPVRCASILAAKYAAVSATPTTNSAAQHQVLSHLEASNLPKITDEDATCLGSGVITDSEVLFAIKKTRPGTVPGPDGIPIGFFHWHKQLLAPLLARVYTAIYDHNAAPSSFSLGVIHPCYKLPPGDGDNTDGNLYRPLSLLDVDYRLLASILSIRLRPILPRVIHPEQSAFITGRLIADRNWLPQMLAPLLKSRNQTAALLFCDIAKAFDTFDRKFLWKVMDIMGVGPGFLKWVKILYVRTTACVVVRGYLGDTSDFLAGARQQERLPSVSPTFPFYHSCITRILGILPSWCPGR